MIIDDAAGEDEAWGLQLQRLSVCQPVGFEAVTRFGGRLLGDEVALGGAAAVEAEQAAAKRLPIGTQNPVFGGLPVEDAAILAPGRTHIPIAVEADIDRLGFGVRYVDDGDLLLGRVRLYGQRQMTGIGGEGELHCVAGGVELGGDQRSLFAAGEIQQVDGLTIHHEGELLAIGGEGRLADGGIRHGQQLLFREGAGIAEQAIRLRFVQAIEGGRAILLREINEPLLFVHIQGG